MSGLKAKPACICTLSARHFPKNTNKENKRRARAKKRHHHRHYWNLPFV
jgi:hypothetical protein